MERDPVVSRVDLIVYFVNASGINRWLEILH